MVTLVMMTAAVLAKRTQTPIYTVRHYTRIGLLKPSRDLRNGYKIYKPADKERLKFIVAAKGSGSHLGRSSRSSTTRAAATLRAQWSDPSSNDESPKTANVSANSDVFNGGWNPQPKPGHQ